MKAKIFSLMVLSMFALILVAGLASAVVQFTDVVGEDISVQQGSSTLVKFKLQEMDYGDLDYSTFNFVKPVVFTFGLDTFNSASTISNEITTLPRNTISTEMSLSITIPEYQTPGFYQGYIEFTAEYDDGSPVDINQLITLTVTEKPRPQEVKDCLAVGDSEDLMELEIEDIKVVTGFGDEDTEWVPLDEIEVEVRVENTESDYKLEDVELSWGLYDLDTQEWIFDEDESDFNIKDGKEETLYFTFTLEDPDDFEEDDTYAFYVWANAVGEELENDVCRAVSEDIDVIVESDFLVLNNIQIEEVDLDRESSGYEFTYPSTISCGSTLTLIADLWNLGDADQEDIEVRVYSQEMGIINEIIDIGDVNAFDSEEVTFEFTVPEGMEEKIYTLQLIIQEDGDAFENDYTEEDAEFKVLLDVAGNCQIAKAFVSASLESGGRAGKEMVVRATITNTGDESTTYTFNLAEYAEWASSVSVEPSTLVLGAGQSADVLLKLDVDNNALGEKQFYLELVSEGELVMRQPIAVSIEKSLIGDLFGENGLLTALIIGIAIVLVVIIIILAVRVARK